jgi:hypothetical protein
MRFTRLHIATLTIGLLAAALFTSLPAATAYGQATAVNGSIQGTITDPSNAVLPNVKVSIKSLSTGAAKTLHTDSAGFYTSGPLIPGTYVIDVVAVGFAEVRSTTKVEIGVATSGNLKLPIAKGQEIVEVNAGTVQVNTEQSNVGDVLTTEQIQTLPVNGRNFLDLAQLEPGVQLQSGQSFDPTKAGYSAISFSGISGRTTRILLDGQDITDETVGTTILNVSAGAIDQFQINRSNGDVSGEIGSSGTVLVSTHSGTNSIHGELFGNFQDARAGFASFQGKNSPFQRDQFGGSVGGPILHDKLFLFANAERIKQAESSAVGLGTLFAKIQSEYPTIPAPYKLTYSTGRADYNGPWGVHYFARISYDVNALVGNFGDAYSNYANRDNTPAYAGGADFVTGHFTHSLRASYEKFHNMIVDASGSGVYLAEPSLLIRYASAGLYTGPNDNAPQSTFQSDKQFRYDGSWEKGKHDLRYGVSLNRIIQGGFASFFGLAPRVSLNSTAWVGASKEPTPDQLKADPSLAVGPSDLLKDYSAYVGVRFGNGLGYYTNLPEFGAPAGGTTDWRVGLYVGDSWKFNPRLTINAGIRYLRDTGRTDNALDPIPCSEINTTTFPNPPCSGSQHILDLFGKGLGDRIPQPNFDFAPQAGFAYSLDPASKTVVRGGIGIFRENNVFNAVQFDSPFKLQKGLFNDYSHSLCGGTYSISIPGMGNVTTYNGENIRDICKEPLATSGPKFVAIQKEYQDGSKAAGAAANGSFIGNNLAIPVGNSAYSPNYKTPYSVQINIGAQRKIANGMVFTADYVRQVTIHVAQQVDVNHVGDAKYLNTAAAKAAVTNTLAYCNVNTIEQAINNCSPSPTASDPNPNPYSATISDFSANGLDTGNVVLSGYPAAKSGATPDTGAAFPGKNADVGNGFFSYPAGRSTYNALQLNLREQKSHPVPGIADSNLEISYSLSRFLTTSSTGSDQFFGSASWDNNHPTKSMGWGDLDHTHNLAFGGAVTITRGPQIALIAHFQSPIATSLILDNQSGTAGQIFITNVNGDGQSNENYDLVPGTKPGAYGRSIKGKDLKNVIANYNSKYAGQLTPAGAAVVNAGILTSAQMTALGAVQQPIATPPDKPYTTPGFRSIDLSLNYPYKLKFISEKARLEPVIAFYNVGNLANFSPYNSNTGAGGPNGLLLNTTDAGSGNYANGPNNFDVKNANRTGRGSGTFDQGGPRSIEYQLKIIF